MRTITFATILMITGCSVDYEKYELSDAFIRITLATDYRRQKCGSSPSQALFPVEDSPVVAVDLCTFSLMRDPCPFDAYPAICYEIFGVDLPGVGP